MRVTIWNYLGKILAPFPWALMSSLGFILSFLGYIAYPEGGVHFSKIAFTIVVFLFTAFAVLVITIINHGWRFYKLSNNQIEVISIQKFDEDGGGFLILLKGSLHANKGTLIDLKRKMGDRDAPFGMAELGGLNSKGLYECKIIEIAPNHKNDLQSNNLMVSEIVASLYVDYEHAKAILNKLSL